MKNISQTSLRPKELPESITEAIKKCPLIIGIGPSAWPRIISSYYFPKFKILCYNDCQDNEYIRKLGVEVYSLRERDPYLEISPVTPGKILETNLAKEFLSKQKEPFVLLVYKSTGILEKVCEENEWKFLGNTQEVRDRYEDKRIFKEILREIGMETIPGDNIPVEELTPERFSYYQEKLRQKKLVLQIAEATWGGGSGTLFIEEPENLQFFNKRVSELRKVLEGKKKKIETVNIAPYIDGISASISCCTTKYGVLTGSIQTQIVDIEDLGAKREDRSGSYAGHDWGFMTYGEDIQHQASKVAQRFGDYLYKKGYKGIFGLDLIVEKSGKVWPVECNPRETDAFPLICMLQMDKGVVPMQLFHNLEHLGVEYDFDFEETDRSYKEKYDASQILIYNKFDEHMIDRNTVSAGVNRIEDGRLRFLKPGVGIGDLENENEFLITEDIAKKPGSTYRPHERILRVIKKGTILKSKNKITSEVKEIAEVIYKELKLIPIENGLVDKDGLKTLFAHKIQEAKNNPRIHESDMVNVVRPSRGGFLRPLSISWRKKITSEPVLSQIRSKRASKQIVGDIKKLVNMGVEIKILPEINETLFCKWHDLYEKIINSKDKGRVVIKKDWLARKKKMGKKVGAILAFKSSEVIGGNLFFDVGGVLGIGYGVAERIEELAGGLSLLLDYYFLVFAQEKGYKEVSLGKDTNLYGYELSCGLVAYKAKLGFFPVPANKTYWVSTFFLNTDKFKGPIMFFTGNSLDLGLAVIMERNYDIDIDNYSKSGVKVAGIYDKDLLQRQHKELFLEDEPK